MRTIKKRDLAILALSMAVASASISAVYASSANTNNVKPIP